MPAVGADLAEQRMSIVQCPCRFILNASVQYCSYCSIRVEYIIHCIQHIGPPRNKDVSVVPNGRRRHYFATVASDTANFKDTRTKKNGGPRLMSAPRPFTLFSLLSDVQSAAHRNQIQTHHSTLIRTWANTNSDTVDGR